MNTIIVLDTNILREIRLLKDIKIFIDKHTKIGDIYITETVLDELTNSSHNLMEKEVIETLSKYSFMYKLLEIEYDMKKIHSKEYFQEIKTIIKDLFEDNIISLGTINLNEVYERAIKKIPPFDNTKPSDSGFKDTLIWLSILNYDFKNYSEILFITKDKIFKKNEKFFQKEFEKKHDKLIYILDELPSKNIDDPNKQIKLSEDKKNAEDYQETILNDYHKIYAFKNDLEEILNEIVYITKLNYDYYEYDELRFIIHQHINITDLESFKTHLISLVEDNGLSPDLKVLDFLSPYCDTENISENYNIKVNSVFKLLEIISRFQKVLPRYTNTLLSAINNKINTETYQLDTSNIEAIDISDDSLPF